MRRKNIVDPYLSPVITKDRPLAEVGCQDLQRTLHFRTIHRNVNPQECFYTHRFSLDCTRFPRISVSHLSSSVLPYYRWLSIYANDDAARHIEFRGKFHL